MNTLTLPATARRGRSELIKKYATAALFAVIGGTGVLLFFHIGDSFIMGAHEWLGLAFVAAVGLHIARNWRAFVNLVKKRRAQAAMALSALTLGAFVLSAGPGGGNPMKAFVDASLDAPLPAVAAVLEIPMTTLKARLATAGVTVGDETATLGDIAAAQGVEPPRLFAALMRQN